MLPINGIKKSRAKPSNKSVASAWTNVLFFLAFLLKYITHFKWMFYVRFVISNFTCGFSIDATILYTMNRLIDFIFWNKVNFFPFVGKWFVFLCDKSEKKESSESSKLTCVHNFIAYRWVRYSNIIFLKFVHTSYTSSSPIITASSLFRFLFYNMWAFFFFFLTILTDPHFVGSIFSWFGLSLIFYGWISIYSINVNKIENKAIDVNCKQFFPLSFFIFLVFFPFCSQFIGR